MPEQDFSLVRTLAPMLNVEGARKLAESNLATVLPRRWLHVQGVASRASAIASAVGDDGEMLVMAAWLHDIGYSPRLAACGFHPFDGARYLVAICAPTRLASLVAHHSYALLEAKLRGLESQFREFDDERSPVRDALWYSDLTTSPDGEQVTANERIAEIKERYGHMSLVTRFITDATPELMAAAQRTEERLSRVAD